MNSLKMEFIGRRENISTFKAGPYYLHGQNKAAIIKALETRKLNEAYYVSETYSQVTEESAQHGDFSETGYEDYGSFMTLKELLERISAGGFDELNFHGTSADLYQSDWTTDYRTGVQQGNCLHVTAASRNMTRLERILEVQNG